MKPLYTSFILILICSLQIVAKPSKKGEVIFSSDFNNTTKRAIWSSMKNANWVEEGIGNRTCLRISGEGLINTTIDLSAYRGMTLLFRCLAKAENVTKPAQSYLGVKYMLHCKTPSKEFWQNENDIFGTFNWKELTFYTKIPNDASLGDLSLGLQGCSGKVWFDSISIIIVRIPEDYKMNSKYNLESAKTIYRGFMVSGRFHQDELITLAKTWKVNLIRWQLTMSQSEAKTATTDLKEYGLWIEKKLQDLEKAIEICKQNNIKIVIDLHSPPGGRKKSGAMVMFYDKTFNDYFIKVWSQISSRFKNNSSIFGYDLINEPIEDELPTEELNNVTTQSNDAKVIRKIDRKTPIIVEAESNDFASFTPINIANVIYEAHMYSPHAYTHQGINNNSSYTYPGVIDGTYYNEDVLKKILKPVRDFQLKFKVPVYIGEFSAVRWAPGAAHYIGDCIDIFEQYGWNWTYHAFGEWDGWSVEYENGTPDNKTPIKANSDTDRKKILLKAFSENLKIP